MYDYQDWRQQNQEARVLHKNFQHFYHRDVIKEIALHTKNKNTWVQSAAVCTL